MAASLTPSETSTSDTESTLDLNGEDVLELTNFIQKKAWIDNKIDFLSNLPLVDHCEPAPPTKCPTTRSEIDAWWIEHARIEEEITTYDMGDLAKLKAFARHASKKHLSPESTDLIEIALQTLYSVDKLLHLLRSRKRSLKLLDYRIQWETNMDAASQAHKELLNATESFIGRARWSIPDSMGANTRQKSNLLPANHRAASSTNSSTQARAMRSEILSLSLASLSQKIHQLSNSLLPAAGGRLDRLIDTSPTPLPNSFLDKQELLEEELNTTVGGLRHYLKDMATQWKKADEIFFDAVDVEQKSIAIRRDCEEQILKIPAENIALQFEGQIKSAKALLQTAEQRAQEVNRPTHTRYPDQDEVTTKLVDTLNSNISRARSLLEEAEATVGQYRRAVTVLHEAQNVTKKMRPEIVVLSAFGTQVEVLEDRPDLTSTSCFKPSKKEPAFDRALKALRDSVKHLVGNEGDELLTTGLNAIKNAESIALDPNVKKELSDTVDAFQNALNAARKVEDDEKSREKALISGRACHKGLLEGDELLSELRSTIEDEILNSRWDAKNSQSTMDFLKQIKVLQDELGGLVREPLEDAASVLLPGFPFLHTRLNTRSRALHKSVESLTVMDGLLQAVRTQERVTAALLLSYSELQQTMLQFTQEVQSSSRATRQEWNESLVSVFKTRQEELVKQLDALDLKTAKEVPFLHEQHHDDSLSPFDLQEQDIKVRTALNTASATAGSLRDEINLWLENLEQVRQGWDWDRSLEGVEEKITNIESELLKVGISFENMSTRTDDSLALLFQQAQTQLDNLEIERLERLEQLKPRVNQFSPFMDQGQVAVTTSMRRESLESVAEFQKNTVMFAQTLLERIGSTQDERALLREEATTLGLQLDLFTHKLQTLAPASPPELNSLSCLTLSESEEQYWNAVSSWEIERNRAIDSGTPVRDQLFQLVDLLKAACLESEASLDKIGSFDKSIFQIQENTALARKMEADLSFIRETNSSLDDTLSILGSLKETSEAFLFSQDLTLGKDLYAAALNIDSSLDSIMQPLVSSIESSLIRDLGVISTHLQTKLGLVSSHLTKIRLAKTHGDQYQEYLAVDQRVNEDITDLETKWNATLSLIQDTLSRDSLQEVDTVLGKVDSTCAVLDFNQAELVASISDRLSFNFSETGDVPRTPNCLLPYSAKVLDTSLFPSCEEKVLPTKTNVNTRVDGLVRLQKQVHAGLTNMDHRRNLLEWGQDLRNTALQITKYDQEFHFTNLEPGIESLAQLEHVKHTLKSLYEAVDPLRQDLNRMAGRLQGLATNSETEYESYSEQLKQSEDQLSGLLDNISSGQAQIKHSIELHNQKESERLLQEEEFRKQREDERLQRAESMDTLPALQVTVPDDDLDGKRRVTSSNDDLEDVFGPALYSDPFPQIEETVDDEHVDDLVYIESLLDDVHVDQWTENQHLVVFPSFIQAEEIASRLSFINELMKKLEASKGFVRTVKEDAKRLRQEWERKFLASKRISTLASFGKQVAATDTALSNLLMSIDAEDASLKSMVPLENSVPVSEALILASKAVTKVRKEAIVLIDDDRVASTIDRIEQTFGEMEQMVADLKRIRPSSRSSNYSATSNGRRNSEGPVPNQQFLLRPISQQRSLSSSDIATPTSRARSRGPNPTPLPQRQRVISVTLPTTPKEFTFSTQGRSTVRRSESRQSLLVPEEFGTPHSRGWTSKSTNVSGLNTSSSLSESFRGRKSPMLNQSINSSINRRDSVSSLASPLSLSTSRRARTNTSSPSTKPKERVPYKPNAQRKLDVAVGKIVNEFPVSVPIKAIDQGFTDESGMYWIGDEDPRMYFCRILRSKLCMVRVGGGWQELSSFLYTHFSGAATDMLTNLTMSPHSPQAGTATLRASGSKSPLWISSKTLSSSPKTSPLTTSQSPITVRPAVKSGPTSYTPLHNRVSRVSLGETTTPVSLPRRRVSYELGEVDRTPKLVSKTLPRWK